MSPPRYTLGLTAILTNASAFLTQARADTVTTISNVNEASLVTPPFFIMLVAIFPAVVIATLVMGRGPLQ